MPVQAVDVNVHPAKTEVKFLSEREVFDAVHYAVLSTLNKAAGRPEWKASPKSRTSAAAAAGHSRTAVQPPKPGFYQTMQAAEYRRQAAQTAACRKPAQPVLASPVQIPRSEPAPAQQRIRAAEAGSKPEARSRAAAPSSRPEPKPEPKPAERPEPKPAPVRKRPKYSSRSLPVHGSSRSASSARRCTPILSSSRARPFCSSTSMPRMSAFALRRSKRKTTPSWPSCCSRPSPRSFRGRKPQLCWKTGRFWSAAALRPRTSAAATCSSGRSRPTWTWKTPRRLLQELAGKLLAGKTLDPDSLRDELLHTDRLQIGHQGRLADLRRGAAAAGAGGSVPRRHQILPPWPPRLRDAHEAAAGKAVQEGMSMDRIICVVGPTASGKTKLAVQLGQGRMTARSSPAIPCRSTSTWTSARPSPRRRRWRASPTI